MSIRSQAEPNQGSSWLRSNDSLQYLSLQYLQRKLALHHLTSRKDPAGDRAARLVFSSAAEAVRATGEGAERGITALTWLEACARPGKLADWLPDVLYCWHEADVLLSHSPWRQALEEASPLLTATRTTGCVQLGNQRFRNACRGVESHLSIVTNRLLYETPLKKVFQLYWQLFPAESRSAVSAEEICYGAWCCLAEQNTEALDPYFLCLELLRSVTQKLPDEKAKPALEALEKYREKVREVYREDQRGNGLRCQIADTMRLVRFRSESLAQFVKGFQPANWRAEVEWEIEQALHRIQTLDQADHGGSQAGRNAGPSHKRTRMTVGKANVKAIQLAKSMKQVFFLLSEREQARRIGCSWETWKKTSFYKEVEKKRGRLTQQAKAPPSPRVTSLTRNVEAVIGDGDKDEVLKQLIAEQEADREPSPLDDLADSRPKRVRCRKRL